MDSPDAPATTSNPLGITERHENSINLVAGQMLRGVVNIDLWDDYMKKAFGPGTSIPIIKAPLKRVAGSISFGRRLRG